MDRASADHMGMLATVMNARHAERAGKDRRAPTRVQSAIPMGARCKAPRPAAGPCGMERGVVIFAAGTGNPYFTTDHGSGASRQRDGLRRALQGHAGRRRSFRRPKKDPAVRFLSALDPPRRSGERPYNHGRGGDQPGARGTTFRSSCSTSTSSALVRAADRPRPRPSSRTPLPGN